MINTVPIQLDIQPQSLELLCMDLKLLSDGIEKALHENVFEKEEAEKLCNCLDNLGGVILALAKSVEKTIQKANDLKLNNDKKPEFSQKI